MTRKGHAARLVAATAVLASAAACGGGGGETTVAPPPPPVDTTLSISAPPSVAAGGTVAVRATLHPSGTPAWTSETPGVATVSGDGKVTGVAPGDVTVRATYGSKTASVTLHVFESGFASLSVGDQYACALTSSRATYCWGATEPVARVDRLETCRPPTGFEGPCTTTPQLNTAALPLARLTTHWGRCGLTDDGEAYCWGENAIGRPVTPAKVPGSVRFATIEAGGAACGLDANGVAYCWGYDVADNLGAPPTATCGTEPCSPSPTPVLGNHVFRAISVGGAHACALTVDGEAWCWGYNGDGQLGNGGVRVDYDGQRYHGEQTPVRVDTDVAFETIEAGQFNTCALTAGGQAYCWGRNSDGQVGIGAQSPNESRPVPVTGGLAFVSISIGLRHTCGLTSDGTAYCWGDNGATHADSRGSIGDGTTNQRPTPTAVSTSLRFVELGTRYFTTCGRVASGRVYCWGNNYYGQLGIGSVSAAYSTTPVGVGGVP
jgi:hypothetical protein